MNELKQILIKLMQDYLVEDKRGKCISIFKFSQLRYNESTFLKELRRMYFNKYNIVL
jgi:hypothetical protein